MGNEMGNSNVTGLQEEENRTVETAEKYLQEDGCGDNVKEEKQTVPAVEDKDFHGKVAGLASSEGNQTVPAVEDTNLHEKDVVLASGEGNQIVPAVEETDFQEKTTGLASGEEHQIVPGIEDTKFHEKVTELASGEEHQIVPAVEDIDFHEILERLPSDEENQTVPAIEDKDIHEKVTGLASDDLYGAGNPCINHQTSDEIEQGDSKVQPSGSPKSVIESKDGNTEIRIQPASLSADEDNDETLTKSNLEDKLLETREKQIEGQISSEREEEETRSSSCTNSVPNNPEHLRCVEPDCDLHELDTVHVDTSVENHTESMQRSEEILGLIQIDAELVTLAESVGSGSNPEIEKKREEMASREEEVSDTITHEKKDEIGDGDEVPNGLSRTSSGSGNNSDEELHMEMKLIRNGSLDMQQDSTKGENGDEEPPGEMNLIRKGSYIQQESKGKNGDEGLLMEMNLTPNGPLNLQPEAIPLADSLNSFQEVAEPEVKCLVLTEETELIRLGLENQDDMYDLYPTQLCKVGKEGVVMDTSCSSAMDKDFQVEETKVLENAYKLHSCDSSSPNSICSLSKMDTLPSELIVIDCNQEGNEPTEKKMEEEIIEKTKYSYTMPNDSVLGNHSPLELQQHGNGEFSLIQVSNLDASDLTMENLVFAVELANKKPGQELPQNPKTTSTVVELCRKDETQEGGERVSTESSPESLAIQAEMRKSPSFHFELLAEGSTEDSDQTPLLYHDKTVTGSLSRGECGQDLVDYQAMPGEEESLKLEKSESDKSRTPFLSFLKEEEEARLVASQKNQDTVFAEKESAKEVWDSTSPKRRTKRRSKSSLFSNCICCATAIS